MVSASGGQPRTSPPVKGIRRRPGGHHHPRPTVGSDCRERENPSARRARAGRPDDRGRPRARRNQPAMVEHDWGQSWDTAAGVATPVRSVAHPISQGPARLHTRDTSCALRSGTAASASRRKGGRRCPPPGSDAPSPARHCARRSRRGGKDRYREVDGVTVDPRAGSASATWVMRTGYRPALPARSRARQPAPDQFPETQKSRRRPIFPKGCPLSIFGAGELNFRVRDGNGCGLSARVTGILASGRVSAAARAVAQGEAGRRSRSSISC